MQFDKILVTHATKPFLLAESSGRPYPIALDDRTGSRMRDSAAGSPGPLALISKAIIATPGADAKRNHAIAQRSRQ
jgi:hypothetical protein